MEPLILDATTKSIEAVLSGAITTSQPEFTAGWADDTGSSFTEGASDGALNSTTPVTLVAAPAAATRRVVKYITVYNKDTVAATLTVSYNNNSTLRIIAKVTLAAGDTWTTDGTFTSTGALKYTVTTAVGGSNTQVQYNNAGSLGGITGATSDGTVLTVVSGLATTAFSPSSNDGATLGTTALGWSDLHLASTATINIANGNWVATHSSGILTVTTGDLRVTSANVGTNADSVPTLSSTSTLTNKTLTSPAINTSTLGGHQTLLENAALLYDAAMSADGKYNGWVRAGTAGTTLAFGDLIYLDPTDSRWELADANAAQGADGDSRGVLGICVLAAAADGDPTVVLLQGIVRADTAFPTFTVNNQVYVSETAGDVTGTQPTTTDVVIRVVGVGLTADELYFNPSPDFITHT